MKIKDDVLDVLKVSTVNEDEKLLFLPNVTLERKLYVDVNKVLESINGKWNRKLKAHLFPENPSDILDEIINTGEYTDKKKEYQFFPTPKHIVKQLIELADIKPTDVLFEPEAGDGAILEGFPKENPYVAIELMPENCKTLRKKGFSVLESDTLAVTKLDFDKAIMNPPFHGQADVKHIFHIWGMMKTGNRLVSVVSESPFFRENDLSKKFRKWLEENDADVIELEAGEFRESGTLIKTRIIVVGKK